MLTERVMNKRGVTLIELIVVISIMGILIAALGFYYQGWMGRYRIETQIKEMQADLMNARARAMNRNRAHFVTFPSVASYTAYEDTNPWPDGNATLETAADARLGGYPKTTWSTVSGGWGTFTFNKSGLISPQATIYVNSTLDPDYDCIVTSQTRLSIGKMTAGWVTCNIK